MNDFKFGNYISFLREKAKLSQSELGKLLGVSNKAVSKWENGRAKPSLTVLKEMSHVFNISMEQLINLKEEIKEKSITKIVLTGGPCAGKTTAMSKIQAHFTNKGYAVIFVPEAATELINAGLGANSYTSMGDFENAITKLQIAREKIYLESAKSIKNNKILIVCDRGSLDAKAYISQIEFNKILNSLNLNEVELRDNYDAVFHLVTAAKGAEKFYTNENNAARRETLEEARIADDNTIAAWTGHPHFRVIDNSSNFEDKMQRLIEEISGFLGEPDPFEIERKFLIEYPNLKQLETTHNCKKVEIIQTYLTSNTEDEIRVRQRGENGNFIYYKTTKHKISGLKRIETEIRLTKEEYLKELMNADTTKKQIRKSRYCLTYNNQYFEIDIYPFWKDKAIMEIELNKENQTIHFPNFIKVIKEITNDEKYKNISLAKL